MSRQMKFWRSAEAGIYGRSAAVLIVAAVLILPVALSGWATAITNTYSRSITMSSSAPSATGVTYSVSFTADASYSLRTIIVDFCSNSPLEGQSCTAPTTFSVGTPTAANLKINGSAIGGTWTPTSLYSGRTFEYDGSAGQAVVAGDVITFDMTSITNPSTVDSFYARMFTYSIASPSYSDTATDTFEENGEVALSTATGAGFVFQVPETIDFCVYQTTCGDTPALTLGHGANNILDATAVDTATAKFSIATNALSGAIVRAHGATLKNSLHTFAASGGGSGVQTAMTAGTEAFGLKASPTTGAIQAATCFADTGSNDYCFDNAMVPPSTAGAAITTQPTPGPISSTVFTITFGATASPTTPSGEYSTVIVFVATGTF